MKKILFVDDEDHILRGLRNLLRKKRNEWEMVFALGGEAALGELAKGHFDVVVTDMRMPKIDGPQLLTHLKKHHPETVRIVLSGYADLEATMKAVPVSHQFLSKPCDPQQLEEAIGRACGLQALMSDETLRRVVGGVQKLPAQPRTFAELGRLLARQDTTAEAVAKVLREDMSMSAKILQLVNSSYFGLPRRISSVEDAVVYLGFKVIRNLTLSIELFAPAQGNAGVPIERLQQHAIQVATVASKIIGNPAQTEDAFVAGLLHAVGSLVLLTETPDYVRNVRDLGARLPQPLARAEQSIYGVTHAEVGAYLVGIWGLPYPVVEAVAQHHTPTRTTRQKFDLVGAVYVADALVSELEPSPPPELDEREELDADYLAKVGVAERLPEWRKLTAAIHAGGTP